MPLLPPPPRRVLLSLICVGDAALLRMRQTDSTTPAPCVHIHLSLPCTAVPHPHTHCSPPLPSIEAYAIGIQSHGFVQLHSPPSLTPFACQHSNRTAHREMNGHAPVDVVKRSTMNRCV